MAAPITHVMLAEKILASQLVDKNRQKFLVGTSFPDIRYFDNLDRQITHFKGVTMAEVRQSDSFTAGLKFHSLVDEAWENFYIKQPDYPFVLEPKHLTGMSLKFLEDEIYYRWVNDWPEMVNFFIEVLPGELTISSSSSAKEIGTWHRILINYFKQAPDDQARRNFMRHSELAGSLAGDINQFIAQLRGNQRSLEVIGEFYDYFCRQIGLD